MQLVTPHALQLMQEAPSCPIPSPCRRHRGMPGAEAATPPRADDAVVLAPPWDAKRNSCGMASPWTRPSLSSCLPRSAGPRPAPASRTDPGSARGSSGRGRVAQRLRGRLTSRFRGDLAERRAQGPTQGDGRALHDAVGPLLLERTAAH
jgi:hypothetical protein